MNINLCMKGCRILKTTTNSAELDEKKVKARKKKSNLNADSWQFGVMQSIGLIHVFIFCYIPMFGIIIAFKKYRFNLGIFDSPWCGLENFEYMFKSDVFVRLIRNTVGYNVVWIILGIVFSIMVALFMENVHNNKLAIKVFQSAAFLPKFLSWVVVSYISYTFLSLDTGFLNKIITMFGGQKISFYSETKYWPAILTVFNLWKGFGTSSLIYYGSMMSIDTELYEAASLDGCTYFKRIWNITLPHLRPTIVMLLILSVGGIFRSDFGLFYYLPQDNGALYNVTDVLDTYITRALRVSGELGMASAASFLQSVVGFVLVVTTNKIVSKLDSESSLF